MLWPCDGDDNDDDNDDDYDDAGDDDSDGKDDGHGNDKDNSVYELSKLVGSFITASIPKHLLGTQID